MFNQHPACFCFSAHYSDFYNRESKILNVNQPCRTLFHIPDKFEAIYLRPSA
jgi:hypothetical protein